MSKDDSKEGSKEDLAESLQHLSSESLLDEPSENPQENEALAKLEARLAKERDGRNEDRFIGLVILVIILDVYFFSNMPSFTGPVIILFLELLILLPIAQRLGVKQIVKILDRTLGYIPEKLKPGK